MVNIPNVLCVIRIFLSPIIFWLLIEIKLFENLGVHKTWIFFGASLLFVVASVTDFFDGFIARKLNQESILGQILDPLADKMLMLAAFLGLLVGGIVNPWAIYIILLREFFITGLRVVATAQNINVQASTLGKIKTFCQMTAVGFLMMDWVFASEILWIAVFFTIYSGAEYAIKFAHKLELNEN